MLEYYLQIAGFNIKLNATQKLFVEEGYEAFLIEPIDIIDFWVSGINGLPGQIFEGSELVFEAADDSQKFYDIYRYNDGLGFVIYNQQTPYNIQQIAVLEADFKHWTVYSEIENNMLNLMRYPMGPIIMHYMTLKTNAVMLHASCAFDGHVGRIFTGFSGNGKSTMSQIWANAGSMIVNDDRLIVREEAGDFFVYNTPMYYKDIPKKAPLHAVFLISHSPQNKIKKLSGAIAISRMMAFSIQNNFQSEFIHNRIGFFSRLAAHIPIFDLGFVPNESVVSFIKAHEKE